MWTVFTPGTPAQIATPSIGGNRMGNTSKKKLCVGSRRFLTSKTGNSENEGKEGPGPRTKENAIRQMHTGLLRHDAAMIGTAHRRTAKNQGIF